MLEGAPIGANPSARRPTQPKHGLAAEEYAALEATLRGTPVGRLFLAEYIRRHRTTETQLMLDAITRLEAAVFKPQHRAGFASLLGELKEIARGIARTRQEMREIEQRIEAAITIWGSEDGTRSAWVRNHADQLPRHGEGSVEAPWPAEAADEPRNFEPPDPLTLSELQPVKWGALFG